MDYYSETSLALLIDQANSGDWHAAGDLSLMYRNPGYYRHSEILERDEAEAERWHREYRRLVKLGAENGDKDAMFQYAEMCWYESGEYTDDAFSWVLRAANAGNLEACESLAFNLADKQNPRYDLAEAWNWAVILAGELLGCYQRAANGDAEAQYQMGNLFSHGLVLDQDEDQAREGWRKAASQGHKGAISLVRKLRRVDE